jgi:hypothetical protein
MKSIWHPLGNAESRAMFKYDTLFWAVKFMAQLLWLLHECPSLPQWGHVTELVAAVVITGGFINMPALPGFIGQSRWVLLEWPSIPHELHTTAVVPLFSPRADAGEAAVQSRWFFRECPSISQKEQTTGILTLHTAVRAGSSTVSFSAAVSAYNDVYQKELLHL